MMKALEKNLAIEMRREGRSVKEIARLVGVSKSSVSCWTKGVYLSDEHRLDLDRRVAENGRATGAWRKARQRLKDEVSENRGFVKAEDDDYFRLICGLYWGEGAKTQHLVGISNADAEFHRVFMRWLLRAVSAKQVSYSVRYYVANEFTESEVIDHWHAALPELVQCQRCKFQAVVAGKESLVGKCPFGTLAIWVKQSRWLFHEIMGGIRFLKGMGV
jgi:hypothetical protein